MSDTQLINQLQDAGTSMQAFDSIFEKLYPRLCYFAQGIVHDEEEAKDIVMVSFKKFWDKKQNFESVKSITAFIYQVVRNECINYLRKNKVVEKHKEQFIYLQDVSDDQINRLIDKAEIIQTLYKEIEKLPEKCKEVFKLTYLEGVHISIVARELGIAENTIRNHNARAIRLLKLAIGEREFMVAWLLLLYSIIKN